MSHQFLSKTNLNYAIDVQLQVGKQEQKKNFTPEEQSDLEQYFQEFYENDLKTGFYIHTDEGKEEVQFFNYNSDKGWWLIDEENNNQVVCFNHEGIVIKEDVKPEFFVLQQQKEKSQLLTQFYKQYDYILLVIYSRNKENKEIFKEISKQIPNTSRSYVSDIQDHVSFISQEKSGHSRISVFFSKLDYVASNKKENEEISLEKLLKIVETYENNKSILVVPTFVKEEIKDIIREDFGDEADNILNYAQNHRYECLYDSESDDDNDDSSDSDEDSEEDEPKNLKKNEDEQYIEKEQTI